MNEEAKNNLRKGINLLWKGLEKQKEENRTIPEVSGYLQKIETGLNRAETLLGEGNIQDAAASAVEAGNMLSTMHFRAGITLWRKANEMQKSSGMKNDVFFAIADSMLNEAEKLLDAGNTEQAKKILDEYFRTKVRLGLAGPTF